MKQHEGLKWVKLICLYGLIFLMLREWLLPVIELTDTGYYGLMVLFILICLLTNLINMNAIVSILIKIVYIVWFMLFTYSPEEGSFSTSVLNSFKAIFTGDWFNISNTVKSMLFLILLWMTIYLIHHWLTIRRSIMYFFLITVIFLALVDTFTKYNAEMSIVRTMILGIFLTGMLFIEKIISENGMKENPTNYFKLILPLVIMLVLSTVFAYNMPKEQASENLPGPLNQVVKWANSNLQTTGKIGYVEDDDKLGGDFETDNAPVLKYTALEPQYLRIESKSLYTGKGWDRTEKDIYVNTFNYTDTIKTTLPSGAKKDELAMKVKMDKKYSFLIQPYGIREVLESNEKKNNFYIEVESGKIRPTIKKEQISLLNYELTYSPPQYSEKALEKSRISMIAKDKQLSAKERKMNLQLPDNLPDRVANLAESITKDEASVYGKANAIVNYFKTAGYEYSRLDVGFPTNKEDYVDRFLFDTKIGYCDNFSSSMAIMLRTLDIPTRWIKGFSAGDVSLRGNTKEDFNEYTVTNNNAHSWVEVYIPDVGWMPFEPTIGFEGFDQVQEDQENESSTPKNNTEEEKEEQKKQEQEKVKEESEKEKVEKEQKEKEEQDKKVAKKDEGSTTWIWFTLLGLLVVAAVALFFTRRKWMPSLLISYYNQRKPSLDQAYAVLMKQLKKQTSLKLAEGETLAEFAKRVDGKFKTTDMTKLTKMMEKELYDPNAETTVWDNFKECWENLINKTRG